MIYFHNKNDLLIFGCYKGGAGMFDQEVIFKVERKTGWIILNRSKALNALSLNMVKKIREQLHIWAKDESIVLICIKSNIEKAFCSGGDVRSIHDHKNNNLLPFAKDFFSIEYDMDLLIHEYSKPILAYMNGIVMGGGVGISAGSNFRIVTENTKWAMPEMNIGFFPDVGASYFLNQMPGYIGTYLALTAKTIKADDLLHVGAADYYLKSTKWTELEAWINEQNWESKTVFITLQEKLKTVCSNQDVLEPVLNEGKINRHFQWETLEEIVDSLQENEQQGDIWAKNIKEEMLLKSPTSLKVTLEHLRRTKWKTKKECFQMDEVLAMKFMGTSDFFEGVRAVLVDKDQNPTWNPPTIDKVSSSFVEQFFV